MGYKGVWLHRSHVNDGSNDGVWTPFCTHHAEKK